MARTTKVLVVDDSAFAVASITRQLEAASDIKVIGTARNGREAVEKAKALAPDVITMDVVMPEMDGLGALEHIMAERPTPVLMLSALTRENAQSTIRALELGAIDFLLKSPAVLSGSNGSVLAEKIRGVARASLRPTKPMTLRAEQRDSRTPEPRPRQSAERVVVIGTSTGGPRALMRLVPGLPADFPAGVLVVQHMPALFTRSLAERLDEASQLRVAEAADGDAIMSGKVLIAPGDYHMTVGEAGKIALDQGPRVHGVRPAVDVTMKSVAEAYGPAVTGVVLTGMGSDGTEGAGRIKATGGTVIAESESTCAIYGMPQSVVKAGYADRSLPLTEIAAELVLMCGKN